MGEARGGRISEGMQVKSADGERLGKVVACQASGFVVEKGFLFPKDALVPYERVANVNNGEVVLTLSRADLAEPGVTRSAATTSRADLAEPGAARTAGIAARGATLGGVGERLEQFGKAGEITVPLVEEEIVTSKHVEKVGKVHIRKDVVTEEKQITVPVMREVIRVDRVAVTHDVRPGDTPFEREEYDIPISEEHVTIEKRPVVHEEVRIGKEIQQGEETASATVRRERAEVETLGSVRRAVGAAGEMKRASGAGR
jgi:uncharacterized protein (TIGR02271 family)